jgi:hypothetical protein
MGKYESESLRSALPLACKNLGSIWITGSNEVTPPQEDGLLGKILNSYNLNKAHLRVVRNKGNYGVDKMEFGVLRDYWIRLENSFFL